MQHFAFCYSVLREHHVKLRSAAAACWPGAHVIGSAAFTLITETKPSHCDAAGRDPFGFVSGYVRHDTFSRSMAEPGPESNLHREFFRSICQEKAWPLNGSWTGSFSAVAFSEATQTLALCNDLLGLIPLYYSTLSQGILGGSSLILLARVLQPNADPVGVLQRITPPYSNFGRRTLLDSVFRLLPGERRLYATPELKCTNDFDNSLCAGVIEDDLPSVARNVWNCLQTEISLAVASESEVYLALSGGWDSRLVLGGCAQTQTRIHSLTYGDNDAYESRVARRCALAVGATHQCFPTKGAYFPPYQEFRTLAKETEAACVPDWSRIIDYARSQPGPEPILLLGDHCECLDGRNMDPSLTSRNARKKDFARSLFQKPAAIESSSAANYEAWKTRKQDEILDRLDASLGSLGSNLRSLVSGDQVRQETVADLALSFDRVAQNMPPFSPVFDELFHWFNWARFVQAGQNLLLSAAFRPLSPTMSMRALRLISRVHPRLRLRRRLMDAITKLPEFDCLARIPSAQIPWVGARFPSAMREMIWGFRSKADQLLIGRVLKTKDLSKRQRLLKSADFIAEYRRAETLPRVESWFSGHWVKPEPYLCLVKGRADLALWPLFNLDICVPANVSVILDLCQPGNP
jgi:hypothetical protein